MQNYGKCEKFEALHNNVCAGTNSWLNVDPDAKKLVNLFFIYFVNGVVMESSFKEVSWILQVELASLRF